MVIGEVPEGAGDPDGECVGGVEAEEPDPRVLALACDALANGLLMDVMMGMDKEEAKAVWVAAVMQLTRVDQE